MQPHGIYPHIHAAQGEPARLERLPRIRVAQIAMDYLAHGWSADEICRQHPHLTPAEVHAARAYYFDHEDELNAEIEREWDETTRAGESAQPFAALVRLRKLKSR